MLWSQNDALFKKLLVRGYCFQAIPYLFLKAHGFDVEMPELEVRADIADAARFFDTYDLKVGESTIEVKTRSFRFTSPFDWPADKIPAFVDTKKKWEGRVVKPFAYIFVSEHTGAMVTTCGLASARAGWSEVTRLDNVRGFEETFLTTPRETLRTPEKLVGALRKIVAA